MGGKLALPHSLGPALLGPNARQCILITLLEAVHMTQHKESGGLWPRVAGRRHTALGSRVTKAQDPHHLVGRPGDQECLIPKWHLLRQP